MKPEDFKSLINQIGKLIDKRAETTEVGIKAHVSTAIEASEKRIINYLHSDIKASEERTKEELRSEILASRAEAKADNLHLRGKIDKLTKDYEKRLENLEAHTGTENVTKN